MTASRASGAAFGVFERPRRSKSTTNQKAASFFIWEAVANTTRLANQNFLWNDLLTAVGGPEAVMVEGETLLNSLAKTVQKMVDLTD